MWKYFLQELTLIIDCVQLCKIMLRIYKEFISLLLADRNIFSMNETENLMRKTFKHPRRG